MSRIMYVKCDRCGKQFIPDAQHKVGWIGMTWRIPETDDLESGVTPYEHCDFCESCMKAISDFIEGTVIEEEAPPEVEIVVDEPPAAEDDGEAPQKGGEPSEEPKPKKNPPKAKGIDKGKIKALHDAGWNASKIADEMGVSPQTINYHLRRILYGGDADDRDGKSEA
jgi:hypothetical protein